MGSLSDYLEPLLIKAEFGAVAYTPSGTHYVALYTVAPSDAGGGTECTGGSYARVAVVNNGTNWTIASSTVSNGTAVTFPTATASWGTAVAFGILNGVGDLLVWSTLTSSKVIATGDAPTFPIGTLTIALD